MNKPTSTDHMVSFPSHESPLVKRLPSSPLKVSFKNETEAYYSDNELGQTSKGTNHQSVDGEGMLAKGQSNLKEQSNLGEPKNETWDNETAQEQINRSSDPSIPLGLSYPIGTKTAYSDNEWKQTMGSKCKSLNALDMLAKRQQKLKKQINQAFSTRSDQKNATWITNDIDCSIHTRSATNLSSLTFSESYSRNNETITTQQNTSDNKVFESQQGNESGKNLKGSKCRSSNALGLMSTLKRQTIGDFPSLRDKNNATWNVNDIDCSIHSRSNIDLSDLTLSEALAKYSRNKERITTKKNMIESKACESQSNESKKNIKGSKCKSFNALDLIPKFKKQTSSDFPNFHGQKNSTWHGNDIDCSVHNRSITNLSDLTLNESAVSEYNRNSKKINTKKNIENKINKSKGSESAKSMKGSNCQSLNALHLVSRLKRQTNQQKNAAWDGQNIDHSLHTCSATTMARLREQLYQDI